MRSRLLCVCMCLFVVAGCRMASVPDDGEKQGISLAAVRYMASVVGVGAETVEVVVRNGTKKPVSFVKAELDGTELPKIVPSVQKALDVFRRDVGSKKGRMSVPSVFGVRWWQFYPSPDIPAGGYAAFQFNFTERSRPCDLVLTTSDGQRVPVRIPRYSKPKRRIEYLAFTGGWLHDDASLLERDTALIRITQWNSACRIQGSWHDRTGTSRCTCGKPPQTNKGRRCRFTLPRRHWFVPGTATVPTTGEAVLLKDLGDTYGISINNLGSHMLIWIPNKGSGTVRCLGKNDNLACITVDCVK